MKEDINLRILHQNQTRRQKHGLYTIKKKKKETQCSCGSTLAIYNNCVTCLKKIKYEYNLSWMVPGLKCGSEAKVQELASKDATALVEGKKLRLVLDLDETLIHAEKITEMETDSEDEEELTDEDLTWCYLCQDENNKSTTEGSKCHHNHQNREPTISELDGAPLDHSIVRIGRRQYKVWMRPYLLEFLETVKRHFDIYIYTHATREYANTILEALDIKRYIRRVCARDPKEKRKRKKLSKMLCQPNLSLIVDDKRKVWSKDDHANVVRVAPFTGKPQEKHDQVLQTLTTILMNAHSAFYMMMQHNEQHRQLHQQQRQEINFSYTIQQQMTSTIMQQQPSLASFTDIRTILTGI